MSVSTVGSQLSNLYLLGTLRQQLNNVQAQISTGKKGTMLSDLGGASTSSALSLRNSQNLMKGYISNLNTVKTRISVMNQAMGNITETARDTLSMLRSQLQNFEPLDGIMRDNAQTNLQNVIAKLNTKLGDRYLFSGSDVNNAPLADPNALKNSTVGAINTLMLTPFDKDDVLGGMGAINGTALGYDNGTLNSDNLTFRADDGRDIDYTVKASEGGFADILRGLSVVANLPTPTTDAEKEQYWTLVNGAIDMLDRGTRHVDSEQAILGSRTKSITTLLSDHEDNSLTLENFIGGVEDVDMADATMRLQQLQAQLQISYNITASLRNLSLVNYL